MPSSHARLAVALKTIAADRMAYLARAEAAGVERALAARALAGRKVNPSAYLKLCALAGICPETGAPAQWRGVPGDVLRWFFAMSLRGARIMRKQSLRAACAGQSFSLATLCRAEAGDAISTESYLALCAALRIPILHACDKRGAPMPARCFTGNANCNTLKTQEAVA